MNGSRQLARGIPRGRRHSAPDRDGIAAAGGLRVSGGETALAVVTAGLAVAWALRGAVTARAPERTPQWQPAASPVRPPAITGA